MPTPQNGARGINFFGVAHPSVRTPQICTVEPLYNKVLGTMKITLLYQVSHYIRVKKQRNIKSWDQQNYLVIRGFCYTTVLSYLTRFEKNPHVNFVVTLPRYVSVADPTGARPPPPPKLGSTMFVFL